tara:strand:+ start:1836 stop:2237 length:402 start_codon:yes stop_codon:yes gene_type:complete
MLDRNVVLGICSVIAKPTVSVIKAERYSLGYRVKLSIAFRSNGGRLQALHRCFLQNNINSKYKISESKNRQRPILIISKLEDIDRFMKTYDMSSVSYDNNWDVFSEVKKLIEDGKHKTMDGLDDILELKGYLI